MLICWWHFNKQLPYHIYDDGMNTRPMWQQWTEPASVYDMGLIVKLIGPWEIGMEL